MEQHQKSERPKKKPIRLTLSQLARDNIENNLVKEASLASSISDLLEKIGLGEISVASTISDSQPELLHLDIWRRLHVLVKEPAAVFLSTLAFAARLSDQLSLNSGKDALLQVVQQGLSVVFSVGYAFPEESINNPSALLRWAIFRILFERFVGSKKNQQSAKQRESVETPSHMCLDKMSAALKGLESASRSHKLEAFKMKAVDGFTISQIKILFQVQDKNFTEEQAYRRIKDGWSIFRQYWNKQKPDQPNTTLFDGKDVEQIKEYCIFVQHQFLDRHQMESIEELLFQTANDPFLDLLMNEVDYYWYQENNQERIKFLEELRGVIADNLDEWLLRHKDEIDEKLLFCRNADDLMRILEQILRENMDGQSVAVKALLSKNHDVVQKISCRLGEMTDIDDCDVLRTELERLRRDIEDYATSPSWMFSGRNIGTMSD